ncbi:MAG: putative sulfate exporter family transporter [Candidatus Marinimicrobia bacterium]|nr:putative sulfate exporter family transporter [Candidatus Neomarinimicrobiota bacterium]MBO69294.1 putative sulfate exporter family transporter [Candidatus Neomarinimicrobiota bacterium]
MTRNTIIGIILCVLTALLSIQLSSYIGISILNLSKSPISPIIISIIIGTIIGNSIKNLDLYDEGFTFAIKYLLKLGIIFLGIRLSISDILIYGLQGLVVIIPCIAISILIVKSLRNKLNVSENLSLLIAVGTSICGATAIAALAPAINAKKEEISYAIANITVFGLFAMFLYPMVAYTVFNDNSLSVGLFLGTSIHETAQVAGSGMIYSEQYQNPSVLDISTVIKLVRNTMMVIVIPLLAFLARKDSNQNNSIKIASIFPYFIIGFLVFGMIRTVGDQFEYQIGSENWNSFIYFIKNFAEILLVIAMSAIGYNTKINKFKNLGLKPFYLGFIAALSVGVVSFSVIYFLV